MRFRLGLIIGFGTGYYLGAKAGRERYEEIRRYLDRASQHELYEKARAAVDLGIERLRGEAEEALDLSEAGVSTN